jgi:hypothetical protein
MSIWYHHTKPERINSILKFGLKPNSQNNKVEDGLGAEETIRELYKYGTPIFVTKDLNMFKNPGDVTLKLELKESELLPDFPSLIDSGAYVEEYGNSYILYWETSPDGKIDPYKEFDIEDEGSYSELIAVTNTASTFQEILPSKIKLMNESMNNLQKLIESEVLSLLNEAKEVEVIELLKKANQKNSLGFFDDKGELKPGYNNIKEKIKNLSNNDFQWVKKMVEENPEPLPEILSSYDSYITNKSKFDQTSLGKLTPGKIRKTLEDLADPEGSDSEKQSSQIPAGNDVIYKSENWIGFYPKTKEGSIGICKNLSSGVQWCTAATKTKNYFNEYTGEYNIHLYYFFKKGGNTRKEANDAIAIGWVKKDGKPEIIHGRNATVNATNTDLKESDLEEIFGEEWGPVKNKMIEDLQKEERKETAYNKIISNLTPETLNAQLEAIGDREKQKRTLYNLLKNETFVQNKETANFAILKLSKISQELDLYYTKIITLPDNLKVGGNLILIGTEITTLPDNLTVGGDLDLSYTSITTLPNNLTVGRDLNLNNSQITTLPDNLTVDGDLNLSNTSITTLPDNLTVAGNLYSYSSSITTLPDNFKVGLALYLNNSSITTLPNNLTVDGNLDLNYSKITTLPDNLKVGGWLDLTDTKITTLPDNLEVGENLYLTRTEITTLPDNLTVGGNLTLSSTPITTLPDNLKVGYNLYLNNTQITTFPDNLTVGGTIYGPDGKVIKKTTKGISESMNNLQKLIESEVLSLLNEAKKEDVKELIRLSNQGNHKAFFDESGDVKPEKKEEYDLEVKKYHSQLSNIPKQYLSWVQIMSKGDPEPLDEIISMLKAYLSPQNKGKFQGTKLNKDLTPGLIRQKLEELGGDSDQKSSGKIPLGNDEIYKSNNWIGVYPKTEEGSVGACKNLSSGVQWCTAATKTKNYFNEYTGEYNIHLYYFFKKGGNTRKEANDAIAIGWDKKDGSPEIIHGRNATVNAANTDLSELDLEKIFGEEWNAVKNAMFNDLQKEERKETAYNKMISNLTPETLNSQLEAIGDTKKQEKALYDLLGNKTFLQNKETANFAILKLSKMSKDLDLSYTLITTLPDNLTVGGGLYLSNTSITTLPDNLKVGGSLNLYNTPITTLPGNLTVGGSLNLSYSQITTLPDNLTVGGNLLLSNSKITTLPKNLKVGAIVYLSYTSITTLPDNLTVDGSLDLSDSQITTLPDNLTVGGGLYLSNSKITTLPNNLKVGGILSLKNTSITTLPDNLKIGASLDLSNSQITTLPDNLTVDGSLRLTYSQITTLPDNLKIGGYLDLSNSQITTLPDNLTVGGNIYGPDGKIMKKTTKGISESMNNLQEQILTEVMQLLESTNISEGMQYHLDNKIPITETIYRPLSDGFMRLMKEARTLHSLGLYEGLTEDEREILESDLGEVGVYEGQEVPLDLLMVEEEELDEAKYKGKDVKLNKPQRGGSKKFYVYVRDPKSGNIRKVSFGARGMSVKLNDPKRRKAFVDRHRCKEKKDKTTAGYWACRIGRYPHLFGGNTKYTWW